MKTIATNPRTWCGVFLTAAEWNKLRPRVKENGCPLQRKRHPRAGFHRRVFRSVCFRNGSKRNRK